MINLLAKLFYSRQISVILIIKVVLANTSDYVSKTYFLNIGIAIKYVTKPLSQSVNLRHLVRASNSVGPKMPLLFMWESTLFEWKLILIES